MTIKYREIAKEYAQINTLCIRARSLQIEVFDWESNPLENIVHSRLADFLIQSQAINIDEAYNIENESALLEYFINNITPIKVLKRCFLFKIGELSLIANEKGLIEFYVEPNIISDSVDIHQAPCSHFIINSLIALGVKKELANTSGNVVYNYTNIKR